MKQLKRTIPLYFALLLAMVVASCAPASTPAPTAVPPSPTPLALPTAAPATVAPAPQPTAASATTDTELTGASLYQMSCSACHGADRSGNTFEDGGEQISVPALAWDDLSSAYSTDPSRGTVEQQLALAITNGQDEAGDQLEPMMPLWSSLSQTQVDSVIQYLQTAKPGETVSDLSTAATSLMGEQLYQTSCAACHGEDGMGKTFEMDGSEITTPSLHWSELSPMYSTDTSRGSVEEQVALAITKGQDEEGGDLNTMMPRWSFLSQTQVDSLVQYLQSAFQ